MEEHLRTIPPVNGRELIKREQGDKYHGHLMIKTPKDAWRCLFYFVICIWLNFQQQTWLSSYPHTLNAVLNVRTEHHTIARFQAMAATEWESG